MVNPSAALRAEPSSPLVTSLGASSTIPIVATLGVLLFEIPIEEGMRFILPVEQPFQLASKVGRMTVVGVDPLLKIDEEFDAGDNVGGERPPSIEHVIVFLAQIPARLHEQLVHSLLEYGSVLERHEGDERIVEAVRAH